VTERHAQIQTYRERKREYSKLIEEVLHELQVVGDEAVEADHVFSRQRVVPSGDSPRNKKKYINSEGLKKKNPF
jgi:hypothetical protein